MKTIHDNFKRKLDLKNLFHQLADSTDRLNQCVPMFKDRDPDLILGDELEELVETAELIRYHGGIIKRAADEIKNRLSGELEDYRDKTGEAL